MKDFRKPRGRRKVSKSLDFELDNQVKSNENIGAKSTAFNNVNSNPKWNDWKYRIWVELHRKPLITLDDAIKAGGVSQKRAEKYLDKLEADGRLQQIGDSTRGIFYKVMEA